MKAEEISWADINSNTNENKLLKKQLKNEENERLKKLNVLKYDKEITEENK